MKKIVSLLSIIMLFTSINVKAQNSKANSAAAKPTKTAEERTEMWMKKMTEKLSITDAQSAKVKDIVLKREKQRDADREKFKSDKEGFRAASKERNVVFDSEIRKVLTVEQYQKLREARRDARTKAKEKKQKGNDSSMPSDELMED